MSIVYWTDTNNKTSSWQKSPSVMPLQTECYLKASSNLDDQLFI